MIGHIANPFDDNAVEVRSTRTGITIGRTMPSIVNTADDLFNVAWSEEDVGASASSPERDAAEKFLWDEEDDEDEVI